MQLCSTATCGAWARHRVQKLTEPCTVPTDAGKTALRRIRGGVHPILDAGRGVPLVEATNTRLRPRWTPLQMANEERCAGDSFSGVATPGSLCMDQILQHVGLQQAAVQQAAESPQIFEELCLRSSQGWDERSHDSGADEESMRLEDFA